MPSRVFGTKRACRTCYSACPVVGVGMLFYIVKFRAAYHSFGLAWFWLSCLKSLVLYQSI